MNLNKKELKEEVIELLAGHPECELDIENIDTIQSVLTDLGSNISIDVGGKSEDEYLQASIYIPIDGLKFDRKSIYGFNIILDNEVYFNGLNDFVEQIIELEKLGASLSLSFKN